MSLFYKPADAWAADVIPFFWQGEYHLFFLKDYRDPATHGEGTPWFHLGTRDFVHITDYGEALARGGVDEQDLYVFTGSVLEHHGTFHIFYTGHNPHFRAVDKPEQAVMHAISDDLMSWRKLPDDTFFAPAETYEPHDWRDPFVFWNAEAGEFWMLLAARVRDGPSRRRGCTALCASRDLRHWEVRPPLYAPGLFFTHECPDLFRLGEWWYLVFSEFSDSCVTRYRMSRSLAGPWQRPPRDTFDGRAFYAAKTAGDSAQRYVFGWNPTRDGERDDGSWQWGGNIVVHALQQAAGGDLVVRVPDTVGAALNRPVPVAFASGVGDYLVTDTGITITAPNGWGCVVAAEPLPRCCAISATLRFGAGTAGCGIILRLDDALEAGYYVRVEPLRHRLVFDRWPRAGDMPHMVEFERPLEVDTHAPLAITVVLDGSICEVYAAGTIAMSTRVYNLAHGRWGVFASEGTVHVSEVAMTVR